MRATPFEVRATATLREHCERRSVAYAVKQRTDGTWRGVLFSLGDEPNVTAVSRESRLQLVQALTRIATARWPLKRGPKARAA